MTKNAEVLPDTNVVLRYLLRDNAGQYAQAEEFFEKVRIGVVKAVILEGVLLECLYILTKFYKVPRGEATDALIILMQYKGIANADQQELIEALRLFAGQNLDAVDCLLLAKAKRGNRQLFSFDKDLNKRNNQ